MKDSSSSYESARARCEVQLARIRYALVTALAAHLAATGGGAIWFLFGR